MINDLAYYYENLYLECQCANSNHMLKFVRDIEENELWIEYQLSPNNGFWKRVLIAIRYIFRMDEKYGQWHSTAVRDADAYAMVSFLKRYISQIEKEYQ